MNRKRYRYIERESVFNRLRNSTTFLTDKDIEARLDEVDTWRDLTFIFDKRKHGVICVAIIDNDTGLDVAIDDLNGNSKSFYHETKRRLERVDIANYIRNLLGNRAAV